MEDLAKYLEEDFDVIFLRIINFIKELKKKKKVDYDDLAKVLNQKNFFKILEEAGLKKLSVKYFKEYLKESRKFLKEAQDAGVYLSKIKLEDLAKINSLRYEILEGKLFAWGENLRIEFLRGFLSADNFEQMLDNIIPKSPHAANLTASAVNTMIQDFNRDNIKYLFGDNAEIRYKYVGPIIQTSSEQCKWLLQNQKQEGYSLEEIEKGIQTPYGEINFYGRVPNFNCLHRWEPLIK